MTSNTTAAPARPAVSWLPVVMLALGAFCAGTDNYLIAGILSDMSRDLHMPVAAGGLFVTAYSLAYAVGSPVVLTLVRVRSPRRLLLAAIAAFVVVNLLAAVAWAPWVMTVARIVAGCLAGLYSPLAAAAAAGMVPAHRRGRALAIVMGGISVATLAGVPIGVWIAHLWSWRTAFVFVAALAVVATAGIALSVTASGAAPSASFRQRVAPLRRPAVLLALVVTIAGMCAGLMVYTYVEPIFAAAPAVGAGAVGALIMAHGFGALIGLGFGSSLVDRFGSRPVLLGTLTVFTADMALLPLASHTLVTTFAFVFVWGVVGWAFLPAQQHSMIADAPPEQPPMLLSLNGSAMYFGIALGSAIGGAVIAGLGAGRIWTFATAFAAVAVLLSLVRHTRVTSGRSGRRR
ncbi:MFS transporter [Amycolatopsis alkalitolerans]|uniref:MFS transporter n=1 Tax=Amycolatopsis alkalitolerans TaxID=2547244 RepID=A0A5C4M0F6_9PSEU|nr:MFS transporter [Amycolatopsis alkalitolerans]TNC24160.1 MFS transporter [Amycolatopsis alkalitolerans]